MTDDAELPRVGAASGGTTDGGTTTTQDGSGTVTAVGGGSEASSWRAAQPVAVTAEIPRNPFGGVFAGILLAALLVPPLFGLALTQRRAQAQRQREE